MQKITKQTCAIIINKAKCCSKIKAKKKSSLIDRYKRGKKNQLINIDCHVLQVES